MVIFAIAGQDGSGKTTFAKIFAKALSEKGVKTLHIDIPRFSTIPILEKVVIWLVNLSSHRGIELRKHKVSFIVAIAFMLPLVGALLVLFRNRILVIEHYPKIDLVPYGTVYGGKVGALLGKILSWFFPKPYCVIFIDTPVETSMVRISERDITPAPHENLHHLSILRTLLQKEVSRSDCFLVINGENPEFPIQEILRGIA